MAKAIIAYDATLARDVYVFFEKTALGDFDVTCSHCGYVTAVELSCIDDALEEHGYAHRHAAHDLASPQVDRSPVAINC